MALCPLWFWLLNSLIVGLMEEEIRFFFSCSCLTPQSPWLQHLWLANGLSGWKQGGVGLRDDKNNGPSAWVSTISLLRSPCNLLFFFFLFPSNKSGQPMAALCCGGRIHTLYTHTYTWRKKEVSGGWENCETEKKHCRHYCLCRCGVGRLFSVPFNCQWILLWFFYYSLGSEITLSYRF